MKCCYYIISCIVIVLSIVFVGCSEKPSALDLLAQASIKNSEAIIINSETVNDMFKEQIKINAILDKRIRRLEQR